MDSDLIIQKQFQFASERYPALKKVSPYSFTIKFPTMPDKEFLMNIPPTYPKACPSITSGGQQINTPLTDNWIPAYQLVHVVEHLSKFAEIPPPTLLSINRDEIASAINADQVKASSPEGLSEIVDHCQCVINAKEESQKAKLAASAATEQSNEIITSSFDAASAISQAIHEKDSLTEELNSINSSAPSRNQQAKQMKIQALRSEADEIENQIAQLRQSFNESVKLEEYLKNIAQLRERQLYNRIVADALQSS